MRNYATCKRLHKIINVLRRSLR